METKVAGIDGGQVGAVVGAVLTHDRIFFALSSLSTEGRRISVWARRILKMLPIML